jgi:hypothetical protein
VSVLIGVALAAVVIVVLFVLFAAALAAVATVAASPAVAAVAAAAAVGALVYISAERKRASSGVLAAILSLLSSLRLLLLTHLRSLQFLCMFLCLEFVPLALLPLPQHRSAVEAAQTPLTCLSLSPPLECATSPFATSPFALPNHAEQLHLVLQHPL